PDKLITSIMAVLEIIDTTDKTTKAKVLFYLAQVYSILGQNFGTDYPLEWNMRIKMELNQSMSYLSQSMELALQSLNIALSIQDKILIRDCSLLLCETVGQFDPISSITYLILSQNASASIYTENILKRACHITSDSELASLFILINRIKQDETITNANNGIIYRTMMDRLKTYWVI
ncbi:unnamed protein product, partial [Rotaria sp. Silwood1]